MKALGTVTKSEKCLLGFTALFLCLLLVLFVRDRRAAEGTVAVETDRTVPQEALLPDLSPLDINTATAEELAGLPGIGEALAERIVAYRTEHGPFTSPEEIMEVSGIGPGKFEGLKDRITVNGEGTT